MYTEETRRSIDWPSVIKKGLIFLIIALVIFLVIWLFVRNNNSNVTVNENSDNVNNGTITNPEAYSNEFINGFHYVHDIAKDYFLVKELPSNGGTIKYTLRELIDKGLILPFTYKNNETCDIEASYVTVTNENGKYNMTTTLVCGTEVAKTTEELGCNQLCVSGNCKVTVAEPKPSELAYEYQFKQAYTATENVYVCPDGYTKSMNGNNVICVKGNETTVNSTKRTEYNCPNGYTKSGSGASTICIAEKDKTTSLVCPDGYVQTGSGSSMKCSQVVTSSKTQTTNLICPDGYVQTGSGASMKCSKLVTNSTTQSTSLVCPDGYIQSGSGASTTCSKNVANNTTQSTNLVCPDGYTQSGSGASTTCYKNVTNNTTQSAKSVFSYYSCSSGTNLGNGKCRHYSTSRYYITTYKYYGATYSGCSYSGAYTSTCSGKNCVSKYYKYYCSKQSSYDTNATAIYTCPIGYSASGSVGYGTTCYKTVPQTSTQYTNPVCPGGYTQSGSSCVKIVANNSTQTTNPVCPSGYSQSGSSCIKTVPTNSTQLATPICPSGYSKSGSSCIKIVPTNYTQTTNPVCPEGFTKVGNNTCIAKETIKIKATLHTEYVCPSGYTKFGIGSDAKCTKGSTSTVNPTTQSNNVTKYRYKWSCESSLAGWERTGNYRQSTTCTNTNTNEEVIVK